MAEIKCWAHEIREPGCPKCAFETTTPNAALADATEALARIHEIGGNKAAAFTLRQVGAVGYVLEDQLAILTALRHPSSVSDEVVEEPWQVFRRLCTPPVFWYDEAGWKARADKFVAFLSALPLDEVSER